MQGLVSGNAGESGASENFKLLYFSSDFLLNFIISPTAKTTTNLDGRLTTTAFTRLFTVITLTKAGAFGGEINK